MSLAPSSSAGMPRSSSNHHLQSSAAGGAAAGGSGGPSHSPSDAAYTAHSGAAPLSSSSSTPHLSHLRHGSSIGGGAHHADAEHHYPTSADQYDVFEEIGVGAFATVYHAAVHDTGEQVAIKVIDLDQFKSE